MTKIRTITSIRITKIRTEFRTPMFYIGDYK